MSEGAGAYLEQQFGLDGRVAVVVGGTSGIGAAGAVGLARCGARVVVAGRSAERGSAVVSEIEASGGEAIAIEVDVQDEASVEALAADCMERFGRVDVLVNSAGVFRSAPALETSLAEWSRMIDTNLTGTFLCCRAFGALMLAAGGGKIINLASTDSFVGVPEEAAYCASKGGVLQLTRALAAEWSKDGVLVNAIGPTDFETPMTQSYMRAPEYAEEARAAIPVGRGGQVSELVGAIIFLASDAASMVAGTTLMVDGGRTAV
jgi:NAD(P)-dependent dehydrogenase (short-subunit alcohol dehydrogenase family)